MDQIRWCLKQKNGIELIEPNENLRDAYLIKAEDALETLRTSRSKDWQLATAYYTIYYGLYSLLMKIGIKSEIHKCTIEFAKTLLTDYFKDDDFKLIDKAFSARIDSQYYVNRIVPDENFNLIIERTPEFLVKCKNIILEQKDITRIRSRLLGLHSTDT